MLTRMIYFGYISLYASLNLIVGIQIIGSFAYNPVIDARHIADLILAVIVLSISVLCFVGLSKRHDNKPRTVNLRRHIGHALTRAAAAAGDKSCCQSVYQPIGKLAYCEYPFGVGCGDNVFTGEAPTAQCAVSGAISQKVGSSITAMGG